MIFDLWSSLGACGPNTPSRSRECRIYQIHPAGQESVEWEVDDRNFASIGVMETADVGEKVEHYKRIPMKV